MRLQSSAPKTREFAIAIDVVMATVISYLSILIALTGFKDEVHGCRAWGQKLGFGLQILAG
jgi:hypothetical protein